jgi:predicted transcriptional regulator
MERLSPRARQAVEVICRLGEASADDVLREAPSIPTYSAARSVLRSLEAKGLIRHVEKGLRYVYVPTVPRHKVVRSALTHLIETFFEGSPQKMMQALLDLGDAYEVDLDELEQLIDRARAEGRGP